MYLYIDICTITVGGKLKKKLFWLLFIIASFAMPVFAQNEWVNTKYQPFSEHFGVIFDTNFIFDTFYIAVPIELLSNISNLTSFQTIFNLSKGPKIHLRIVPIQQSIEIKYQLSR